TCPCTGCPPTAPDRPLRTRRPRPRRGPALRSSPRPQAVPRVGRNGFGQPSRQRRIRLFGQAPLPRVAQVQPAQGRVRLGRGLPVLPDGVVVLADGVQRGRLVRCGSGAQDLGQPPEQGGALRRRVFVVRGGEVVLSRCRDLEGG